MHELAPADASYWPAKHEVHALAPASENDPAAHTPETADRPAVAQKEPAEQLVHAVAAAEASYWPASQLAQPLAPVLD